MRGTRRRGGGPARALVLAGLVVALAACGGSGSPTPAEEVVAAGPAATVEYAPGLVADLYLPRPGRTHVPLVVLVPGGSWITADPTGLAPLAARLADAGIAAAPAWIRAAQDDVVYPTPVEDVLCAVAAVADRVRAEGLVPGPVAVLGHSSGAHLAALAVLAVEDYSPRCGSPAVRPDALVGLSGPYDIAEVPDLAAELIGSGPDEDPATWDSANPLERAGLRHRVPVLLVHGADDEVLPTTFTAEFASALQDAGHPTTVEIVPGASHQSIYQADVAGRLVARWLLALPSDTRRHR